MIVGVVLVVFLARAACQLDCPAGCTCHVDVYSMACTGQERFEVPKSNGSSGWVESLILAGNQFDEIRPNTFSEFSGLLELVLADNQIRDIANGSFGHLEILHRLDLSGNRLATIPYAIREIGSLLELDLSRNMLWSSNADSFGGLVLLESLYLDNNRFHVFDGTAFRDLQALHTLSMSQNSLSEDPVGWFVSCSKLSKLVLARNEISLTSQVRTWFHPQSVVPLKFLFLTGNRIETIPENSFLELVNLQILDLGENRIQMITKDSFIDLHSLVELTINDNMLKYIDVASFRNMVNLKVLNLDENQLMGLPRGLLSNMNRLNKLNVGFNILSDISAITDAKLQELTELHLASNQLELISDHGFSLMENLAHLYLGGNKLAHVPNVTNLPYLEVIELRRNLISSVSPTAFQGVSAAREIYLDSNRLESLLMESVHDLHALEVLSLYGNPWWCDCKLKWMSQILLYFDDPPPLWTKNILKSVVCRNPASLRDLSLAKFMPDELIPCAEPPSCVTLIVIISSWLSAVAFVTGFYWYRKFHRASKSKRVGKRNARYDSGNGSPVSRNGLEKSESHLLILPNSSSYTADWQDDADEESYDLVRVTTV